MNHLADLYIGGQWRAGGDATRFPVIDPSDGSTLAEFAILEEKYLAVNL